MPRCASALRAARSCWCAAKAVTSWCCRTIAEKIRERDARAVVAHGQAATAPEVVDEAYKEFVVPDDLMW